MLNRPTNKETKALHSLRASKDFQVVRKWLEDSLAEIRERNDREESELQLRRNQGAAQVIKEILSNQDKAHEVLKHN